jgi:hypothetical protein
MDISYINSDCIIDTNFIHTHTHTHTHTHICTMMLPKFGEL